MSWTRRPRLARVPLRWRVTLVALCVQALILAGLGAFLHLRLGHELVGGVDASLGSQASQLLGAAGGEGDFSVNGDELLAGVPRREDLAQILDRGGRVLQGAGPAAADRPLLGSPELARAHGAPVRLTRTVPGLGSVRLLAVPAPGGRVLVVGASLEDVDRAQSSLLLLLVGGGLGAMALGGLGAWFVAGRALRPIDRLSAAAAAIGADDLSERVRVPPTGDEAARLAQTLNALLARVARAVQEQRDFLADASHELRSPVAALRAELEVALRSPQTPRGVRGTLESLQDEADRLARLTDDLLALARADAGRLELVREPTDLTGAALRAHRVLEARAARNGVLLELRLAPSGVWGDPDRLTQVALNLLDNAVRHTPRGGRVTLGTETRGAAARLVVADEGTGVPTELVPVLFQRFSRGDPARGREDGGAGLGLAIAAAIAHAHGGSLELEATDATGSQFALTLPARPE
jgi:signal transduction histidine kinase